jgi:hypothetical protein
MKDQKDVQSPTETTVPPKRSLFSSKLGRTFAVAIVVVVVIAVVLSAIIYVLDHNSSATSPRIALVASSVVFGLTSQKLFTSYSNESSGNYSLNVTEYETMISNYKSASGNVSGTLVIESLKFSSSSSCFNFSSHLYEEGVQDYRVTNSSYTINVQNVTYEGFSFSYFILNHTYTILNATNDYSLYVVGYHGSFAFIILDLNVQLSSYLTLIHDEISVMSG